LRGNNNVQSAAARNLLIASGDAKSLNPNGAFAASYDQRHYEKIIPPLHLLTGAGWQLVWAGSNRNTHCQPDNNGSSNSHHVSNVNRSACINANGYWEFGFIGSRGQNSP